MWIIDNATWQQRIFVQEHEESVRKIIARLQPINSVTVLHQFGHELPIVQLSALIVGTGAVSRLKGLTSQTGTPPNLSGPYGSVPFRPGAISFQMMSTTCQSFDTTRPETDPVYTVNMELQRTTFT